MVGKVKLMLFRPSFCSNCGEKIERAEWFPWTSRRFCQVCETEFKGQDMIPRVVLGLGVLACFLGFGSYFKGGSSGSEIQALRQPRKFAEQRPPVAQITSNTTAPREEKNDTAKPGQSEQRISLSTPGTLVEQQAPFQPAKPKVETGEPMYYCGAETKKGTPCSRRVKGNSRCFQHTGMPAMVSAEKLRIK